MGLVRMQPNEHCWNNQQEADHLIVGLSQQAQGSSTSTDQKDQCDNPTNGPTVVLLTLILSV
jgi:hypothetical protein